MAEHAFTLEHRGQTLRGVLHDPKRPDAVPLVLFFHGYGQTGRTGPRRYYTRLARLLEGYGMASLRVDFLGAGESDGLFEEMTLSDTYLQAEEILAWVRAQTDLNISSIFLVGLSMGGAIAAMLAGKYPRSIAGLILLSAAGDFSDLNGVAQLASYFTENPEATFLDVKGMAYGRAFNEDCPLVAVYETARGYQGPVLLLHGDKDEVVPVETAFHYQTYCYEDRARLVILPDADHVFSARVWEETITTEIFAFLNVGKLS